MLASMRLGSMFTGGVVWIDPVEELLDLSALVASLAATSELGQPWVVQASLFAWIHQDEDAHVDCSLTACLNPLHPGPCKGWKGTLHKVSPGAYHQVEAARVEKANANRVKKIEALKQAGKPIPKKLLTPITAKPYPGAGKTANNATGEAHQAGMDVSANAGVHVNEPGKVTLGQATKTLTPGPAEKGPKNKKPTLASKGIAFVISQPKVTDQYKLDKTAKITPEQWAGLSGDDKSVIRGELAKIQKDGFGPQQKKATELLDYLDVQDAKPKLKPGDPDTITTPSGKTYQKVTLKSINEGPPQQASSPVKPEKAVTVDKAKVAHILEKAKAEPPKVTEAHEPPKATEEHPKLKKFIGQKDSHGVVSKAKVGGDVTVSTSNGLPNADYKITKDGMGWSLKYKFKLIRTSSTKEALEEFAKEHHAKLTDIVAKHEASPPEVKQALETPKPALDTSKLQAAEAKVAEVNAKLEALKAKPKLSETYTPKDAIAKKATAAQIDQPKAAPKPLPKHVEDAIAMAKGHAPGASWSKNHLAAYQPLSAEEFHALPPDVQATVVSELTKGQSKFLDPKKVTAAKALLEKFGHGDSKPSAPQTPVGLVSHLHDHSITQAQAQAAVKDAPVGTLFLIAKQQAGLTQLDNPDAGHHAVSSVEDAKALVAQLTKHHDSKILAQPAIKAAVDDLTTAAAKQSYAQSVFDAKSKAFNKISTKLIDQGNTLSPMEKAALQQYGKHLANSGVGASTVADLDSLKALTKVAENELTSKLYTAVKKANAPDAGEMTNAQIADRAGEILGKTAAYPHINPSLAELQLADKIGKQQVADDAAKYPEQVLTDPAVAAKMGKYASVSTQILATKQEIHKLQQHIENAHQAAILSGKDQHGNPLTAEDKKILAKHAIMLGQSHSHLAKTLEHQEEIYPEAKAQFHAAATKVQAATSTAEAFNELSKPEPVILSDFDKTTVPAAYSSAWSTHASKAVNYGIKTYTQKEVMKGHNQYPAFTQDLGNLKVLAGKVALAFAEEHAAKQSIPTEADTGAKIDGPEKKAWLDAVAHRVGTVADFDALHQQAQTKLNTIRAAAGLTKRSLPKFDSPAVKASAAETGYYKSVVFGAPNYGKSHSAKQYMAAKAGPKIAVPHQTASEKKMAKVAKVTESLPPSPPPKKHVQPPASKAGNPTPATATELGYHYTEKVAPLTHGYPAADSPAYVASPEDLTALQGHLMAESTQYGIAAQKSFKWSINNMVGKGGSQSGASALNSYTGSSYMTINEKLNNLPPGTKKTGSNNISSIDAAMAASPPLDSDVVLYRGFNSPKSVFKSGKWNDVNVAGVEWSQRSYSSTSGSLSTAESFAGGGVVMRIIIPKGMKVHGINAKGGQHAGENEIILERGLRYRVVADYGKHSGRRYIDVMVVPSPYDQPE